MNDELDDRRLRRAVREALNDIVATSPTAEGPHRRRAAGSPPTRRGGWLHVAAGLTAAAGVVGIVAIANRDDEPPAAGEATNVPSSVAATAATNPSETIEGLPTTVPPPDTEAAVPGSTPSVGECGAATVPDGAANQQSIEGDVDGDGVDDAVTLYRLGDEWRVHVTSSVASSASDAPIELKLDDAIDTATVTLADIDSPAAIMVTAGGLNDLGIDANFTFLTLNPDDCVEQWIYRNAEGVDEPFEWVALQEPGHVTGMICEDTAGARRYRLVDSAQNADGTWRVVNRILSHDFTRAEIEFPPEDTVDDSPDFAAQYGSIVNCE